jgi:hypothetical protein
MQKAPADLGVAAELDSSLVNCTTFVGTFLFVFFFYMFREMPHVLLCVCVCVCVYTYIYTHTYICVTFVGTFLYMSPERFGSEPCVCVCVCVCVYCDMCYICRHVSVHVS